MKRCIAAIAVMVATAGLWAQVVHDPNDQLYKDLDRWAVRGYVGSLPQLRPYPAQLLDELLGSVVERGNAEAREKAGRYLAALRPSARPYRLGVVGTIVGEGGDATAFGAPTIDGTLRLEEWLSASYALGIYGSLRDPGKELIVPGTYSPYPDFVLDWANVGPINILQNWTSNLAVGTANLYFQAGLNRTSFGPFFDNGIVVGPQAGRAGHFSLTYRKELWSFSVVLLELTATDDFAEGQYPDKHLILHTIDFKPHPKLELGFYESVVWGGRFEPLYMAPFNHYFAAQSMTGFEDNSLLGFHGRWAAAKDFQVLGQVYIDDLNFNDMVSLKLDTKYKVAGELGLRWAPEAGPLADLAADYTAVMPYMYTHINSDRTEASRYNKEPAQPNYSNYTHRGRNLGTDLEPNSDRFSLRSAWRVVPGLELSLSGYLTRHANASAGVEGMTSLNDGTILDDGYTTENMDKPKATFHYETRFLTQSTIETLAAGGLGLSWSLPMLAGVLTARADYVLEYGWNRDLERGNHGAAHYWSVGGGWRW